jgi:GNAT superfamily N-acetyltransferase
MIRVATLLDVSDIVEMSRQFYPETPYWLEQKIPFDTETVTDLVSFLVKKGIFVVAQEGDKLVGMLGTHVVPFVFNNAELVCVEAIWWVHPDFRKGGIGVDLIKKVDQLRQLRGCKTFQMMRVAGTNPALDKLLIGLGFEPSEYCLTKVN